jgi:hypothetical protein
MLIVRLNQTRAMRAAFAADRDCPFGGRHGVESRGKTTLWNLACSIPSFPLTVEQKDWRGS